MFQKRLNTPRLCLISHFWFWFLTAGQTFWPALQLFFLYCISTKEKKRQQTGSSILQMVTEYFSSTALTFYLPKAFSVLDVQQGILPACIDSINVLLTRNRNTLQWLLAIQCRNEVVWWIFVCSIPRKLQVCCTYCQWLSSRLRQTFSMRPSIKQFYPFQMYLWHILRLLTGITHDVFKQLQSGERDC